MFLLFQNYFVGLKLIPGHITYTYANVFSNPRNKGIAIHIVFRYRLKTISQQWSVEFHE